MKKEIEQDFYHLFRANNPKFQKAYSKLGSLYSTIPSTTGCMENNCKKEGCNSWCCRIQCPQMLYVEFLYVMSTVMQKWPTEQIAKLIDKSVKAYVKGVATKGCIFFDEETNLCLVHRHRSLNCRIYGITPEEEFHPRYLKVKEMYKDVPLVIIKDQCNLCKTANDYVVTTDDTSKWWNKLVDIEKSIGVRKQLINDDAGGSYRTPHDHVLQYFLKEETLDNLQKIRLYANESEKEKAVETFLLSFHHKLKSLEEKE